MRGSPCLGSQRVRREVFNVWTGLRCARIISSLSVAALRAVHGDDESENLFSGLPVVKEQLKEAGELVTC